MILAAAQSKSIGGNIAANVQHHVLFGLLAAGHGVELLVFPELSLTGYELDLARSHVLYPDDEKLDPLRHLAEQAAMTIVAGAPVAGEHGDLHIGALIFRPDGSVLVHTKVHVHSSEFHVFSPGLGGPLLQIGDASIGFAICADISHAEHAANAAGRGANVYAAGALLDAGDSARKEPLLSGYARQHNMAVLLANYSGESGGYISAGRSTIWSEAGAVAASAGTEEALVVGAKRHGVWSGRVVLAI